MSSFIIRPRILYCEIVTTLPSVVITDKYPMISNTKDSYVVQRTKKIAADYLTIDQDVLRETKMCAFFISRVDDCDGSKRAETVMQLLQKLRDDITDYRAALMKDITQICVGKVKIPQLLMHLDLHLLTGTVVFVCAIRG
jgi:hypothetical protein